jgi:ribosomal protein L29
MAEKTKTNEKKIKDLKIELLKNPTKRKSIKKEIARLLTMENQTKSGGKK